MTQKNLIFQFNKSNAELNEIYNFNSGAFADSQDFDWTESNIKKELKNGWEVVSVKIDNDIICALFVKIEENGLLTKNTPLKLSYQGQGLSHKIKDFYEDYAKEKSLNKIYNYCPVDNFRMIALNESHNYVKTGNQLPGGNHMIEWKKDI